MGNSPPYRNGFVKFITKYCVEMSNSAGTACYCGWNIPVNKLLFIWNANWNGMLAVSLSAAWSQMHNEIHFLAIWYMNWYMCILLVIHSPTQPNMCPQFLFYLITCCVPHIVETAAQHDGKWICTVCMWVRCVRFEIRNIPKHCYGLRTNSILCIYLYICPVCLFLSLSCV